jgi:hypothetical protein
MFDKLKRDAEKNIDRVQRNENTLHPKPNGGQ